MKKILLGLIISVYFVGCSTDDNNRINNPNLPDINFRIQLNLDLPEYNNLQFPGNSYSTYSNGIKGIVVYNINNSQYTAFELSDPNHPPSNCSAMQVTGITAKCQCDDGNEYNIVTGELTEGEGQYTLKPYRIERRGNVIEVYN
ncbi:hypothetical protein [Salegentibacter sp.]|uniref:hypothetical protein n=1 Tax=Salegentibacter sp. TaxID=1903072 RepID=UPI00356671FF